MNPKRVPKWNLRLVLSYLLEKPFEPMGASSVKYLSWKTAFLLLLASGRRRGDVCAIAYDRVYSEPYSTGMIMYPMVDYLPKVMSAAEGNSRFLPISIPALTQIIGHDRQEPDRLLCPVRAVTNYLSRWKY
jgi:hypothetical protein